MRLNNIVFILKNLSVFTLFKTFFALIIYRLFETPYKKIVAYKSPINANKAMFISFPPIADNGRAMFEYLYNNTNLKFVWIICGVMTPQRLMLARSIKSDRVTVLFDTNLKIIKEYATARYIFFTHSYNRELTINRKKQKIINLWHGNGYKAGTYHDKNKGDFFDYALVSGPVFVKTKSQYWSCPEDKLLPLGYPRYDIMLSKSETAQRYVEKLKNTCSKFIIWMPTYRKTKSNINPEELVTPQSDIPLLKKHENLIELNEICRKKNVCLCIKRHMMQVEYNYEHKKLSNIIFIDNSDLEKVGIELYSIFRYTDGLISDYSSIAVDYLLLDKPIAFCLEDFKTYQDSRGFIFDKPLDYMPGHHLYKLEDLEDFFFDIINGCDKFKGKRNDIKIELHNPCTNYRERIWKKIKDV